MEFRSISSGYGLYGKSHGVRMDSMGFDDSYFKNGFKVGRSNKYVHLSGSFGKEGISLLN
jgi:hypothetical protein